MEDIVRGRPIGGETLDLDAACELARSKGWLRQTPEAFRRAVLDRCLLEKFKPGIPIYAVGDEPGGMYGIVTGALGVSVATAKQGVYTAHLALPGSWFGQAAAFTRQPRKVGLTATRNSQLLHLPLRSIDEIVKRDPAAWRWFGLLTSIHLDLAMGGSDDLMIRDHAKRFVAILLRAGNCRHHTNSRDNQPVEIDLNHEDLANMANVARTTAGAVLRKLEADGHLELSYRRISILAPNALRKMLRD